MGSEFFEHPVYGVEDPKEAFAQAVEAAEYDHGHAGYTGTIAEKTSYVVMEPQRTFTPIEAGQYIDANMEHPLVNDKWGAAGAVRVKGDQAGWVFFGWASS